MKSCFGNLYPDLSRVRYNQNLAGKVFRLRINSLGVAHQKPQLEIDFAAWEDCQHCDSYRSCYDLSNAKLAMQRAMMSL
jgi:sulfatase maturation enzyme AslB (radical SAM superfamily)